MNKDPFLAAINAIEYVKHENILLFQKLERAKEIIENLCFQFSLREEEGNRNAISLDTSGMFDLEAAFEFLGWDDPHIIDIESER